jgi:hypothetical protein
LFEQNCIIQENKEDSGEKYNEFCSKKCYLKETNDIYGRFPSNGVHVYIEKDIKRNCYNYVINHLMLLMVYF